MVLLFLIQYLKVKKQVLAATKKRQKHNIFCTKLSLLGIQTAQAYEYVFFKPAALKQMT